MRTKNGPAGKRTAFLSSRQDRRRISVPISVNSRDTPPLETLMKPTPLMRAINLGNRRSCPALLRNLAVIVLIQGIAAQAEIVAPYTPDEQTLHLWHMNDRATPVADSVASGTDLHHLDNGATLENESYVGTKNFGTALGTYVGNPAVPPGCAGQSACLSAQALENGRKDNVPLRYAGAADAFTYEAIVRVDFDPTADFGPEGWGRGKTLFMQIISGDADETADRTFQFRLVPIGNLKGNAQPLLEFINLNKGSNVQSLTAVIPTDGDDAIRAGNWYHLAVSYNGQPDHPDNLRFFWTLVSPQRTAANQIGSGQMTASLPTGCSPDFAIGQTGRQSPVTPAPNNNFVGLIDEVRISGVARSPQQMLFGGAVLVSKPTAGKTNPPAPVASAVPAQKAEKPLPAPVEVEAPKKRLSESVTLMNGVVARGPTNQPRLALMFSCRDADPNAVAVLDVLKVQLTKASFFVTPDFLQSPGNRLLVQSMLAQGHYVGLQSDTWTQLASTHPDRGSGAGSTLPAEVEAHLKQLAAFGVLQKNASFFLPTFDQINPVSAARAQNWGLTMVAGTPGTLSFMTATVEGTQQFVSSQAILDSIVQVDHESRGLNGFLLLFPFDSGARRTDKFYSRLGELVSTLRNRGYEFVRVDQLLEDNSTRRTPQPSLVDLKRP
jgi:peptidoglycan/xylan/chitin deacetylase (PgdA/CDA1 family)